MKNLIGNVKNKLNSVNKIFDGQKTLLVGMIATIAAFYIGNALALDPASDILSGAQGDIAKNFGTSSTVMYIIYVVEIFAGIAAYIKTKNLFSLIGLVVVVIFTTVAFGLVPLS